MTTGIREMIFFGLVLIWYTLFVLCIAELFHTNDRNRDDDPW